MALYNLRARSFSACLLFALLSSPGFGQSGTTPRQRAPQSSAAALTAVTTPAVPTGGFAPALRANGERRTILLTGYWPPSNEAVRRFSKDPVQNPMGWIGSDWQGRGYDVVSYFPEFVPRDCNVCDQGSGDLMVDYQDTSLDFWNIVAVEKPIAIMTVSRGNNDMSWEVEMNQYNFSNWSNDLVPPLKPTPSPPDSSVPPNFLRLSKLPVQQIVNAVNDASLGINAFICYSQNVGSFLSGYIAYHGVWYQSLHNSPADPDWCVSAGHLHIGQQIPFTTAFDALLVSLDQLVLQVEQAVAANVCQVSVSGEGPGTATMKICGQPLALGNRADLLMTGAPPNALTWFVVGFQFLPTSFLGGTLGPVPPISIRAFRTNAQGRLFLPGIPGGEGPITAYAQALYIDAAAPQGFGFTNTLEVEFLP